VAPFARGGSGLYYDGQDVKGVLQMCEYRITPMYPTKVDAKKLR